MSADPLTKALERELCESFAVTPAGSDRWLVQTPFLYDDGDALPVIITHSAGAWGLSDEGMTASHLIFDEFEPTESRLDRLKSVAASAGAEIDRAQVIRLALDGRPSAYDVADFLQVISQVRGAAAATRVEREQNRYVTSIRRSIIERLRDPDYDENWAPKPPANVRSRATYRADLRLSAGAGRSSVALFLASTADKTNVAALTAHHFSRVGVNVQPLLAYHPRRVPSAAVYRFQDEVEDDSAVVATTPEELSLLLPALQKRGVAV